MSTNGAPVEAYAIVKSISGRVAWVEPEQRGCGRCHEPGGCGAGSKANLACLTPRQVQIVNAIGAKIGDRVCIQIAEGTVTQAASLGYLLPLFGMVLGALLAQRLNGSDLASMLGALAGGYGGWRLAQWRASTAVIGQPKAIAVMNAGESEHA